MLKAFASVFDNIQVDLNHLMPLQRASQEVQVSVNILIHIQTEALLFTRHSASSLLWLFVYDVREQHDVGETSVRRPPLDKLGER